VVGEEVAAQAVLDVADLLELAQALGDRVGERVALLAGPALTTTLTLPSEPNDDSMRSRLTSTGWSAGMSERMSLSMRRREARTPAATVTSTATTSTHR
jgi:hypothetical protein